MKTWLIAMAAGLSIAASAHAQPVSETVSTPSTAPPCCAPIDCSTLAWRWENVRDDELSVRELEKRIRAFPGELSAETWSALEATKRDLEMHRQYILVIEHYCEGLLLVR